MQPDLHNIDTNVKLIMQRFDTFMSDTKTHRDFVEGKLKNIDEKIEKHEEMFFDYVGDPATGRDGTAQMARRSEKRWDRLISIFKWTGITSGATAACGGLAKAASVMDVLK